MAEHKNCPHCGQSLRRDFYRPAQIFIEILLRMRTWAHENGTGYIADMGEVRDNSGKVYTQLSKMRYLGLIAKYRENGKQVARHWVVTKRGSDWLKGKVAIPAKVRVFDNKIEWRSPESVTVGQVHGSQPYIETLNDIEFDYAPVGQYEPVPTVVFEESGQAKMPLGGQNGF